MPAIPTITDVRKTLAIQTSNVWGSGATWLAGAWTLQNSTFPLRWTNGIGQKIGSADIWRAVSDHINPGSTTVTNETTGTELVGYYVRIMQADPAGVFTIGGNPYKMRWAGRILRANYSINNETGIARTDFICAGILNTLDVVYPIAWRFKGQTAGTNPITVTVPPIANDPEQARGNRAAGLNEWDHTTASVIWQWQQVIQAIMDSATATAILPPFVTTPVDLPAAENSAAPIQFTDQWSLASESALSALLKVCSPRAGMILRTQIDQSTGAISLQINTASATTATWVDSTFAANPVTTAVVPMAAQTCSINLASTGVAPIRAPATGAAGMVSGGVTKFSLGYDFSQVYDFVHLGGGKHWYEISLCYNPGSTSITGSQIAKAWDTSLESGFDALDPSGQETGKYADVFGRFRIRTDWVGTSYSSLTTPVINMTRATDAGEPFNGGFSGLLTASAGSWTNGDFKLTKRLPTPIGYDWSVQSPTTADYTREFEDPQIYIKNGATCQTLADYAGIESVSIKVDDDGSILIGPLTARLAIQDAIAANVIIICTVGIVHWMDLRVSWINPTPTPTNLQPTLFREVPKETISYLVGGTITGIDGSTDTFLSPGATQTLVSPIQEMKSALKILSSWYGSPAVDLTITYDGVLVDPDANSGIGVLNVGQLVTAVTVPINTNNTTQVIAVNNTITEITYDVSGPLVPRTIISTERLGNDSIGNL